MNDRLFPPGLIVEQEITPPNDAKFGIRRFIVRDERWDRTHAPRRHVRVFPDLERTNWGSKLQERLERLFERPLPHVSRPLEIAKTVDGQGTYVVTDWYECTLAMRIAERGLVDDPNRELTWKSFGQLAEGLDALHGVGVPHGALCPACVGVDLTHGTAWIDGAALGPLRHWTLGDYVATEAIAYQAPECQGRSQGPSEKADLYALGRIGIEMLCGSRPKIETDRMGPRAADALRQAGVDSIRRRLLLELTEADSSERPRSAAEVVKRLRDVKCERTRQSRRNWIVGVVAFAVVLLAIAGAWNVTIRAERNAAAIQIGNLGAQVNALTNANLQLNNANLQLDNIKRKLSVDNTQLTDEKRGQERQNQKLEKEKADLKRQLDAARKGQPSDLMAKNRELEAENKKLANDKHDLETSNIKLADAIKRLRKKLGDEGPARDANAEATDAWKKYASNTGLTFDRLGTVIDHDPVLTREAKQIALLWHNEFAASQAVWRIRVVERSECKEGGPCVKAVDVVTGEKTVEMIRSDDPNAEWSGTVQWSVGQPIKINLYDSREDKVTWTEWPFYGTKKVWVLLGQKEFGGPVALWLLKKQKVYAGDGNTWVKIEINCPGPIPDQLTVFDPKRFPTSILKQLGGN